MNQWRLAQNKIIITAPKRISAPRLKPRKKSTNEPPDAHVYFPIPDEYEVIIVNKGTTATVRTSGSI